jgi:hypothetical protein
MYIPECNLTGTNSLHTTTHTNLTTHNATLNTVQAVGLCDFPHLLTW